jgi:hypothetical protein
MTVKLMINTKTGMVSVFDERIIEERPWYVPYTEGDPIPQDPTVPRQTVVAEPAVEPEAEVAESEEDSVEKPKRKNWKEAIAEKAQELSEQAGDQTNTEANQ